jgi:hypothetical protein
MMTDDSGSHRVVCLAQAILKCVWARISIRGLGRGHLERFQQWPTHVKQICILKERVYHEVCILSIQVLTDEILYHFIRNENGGAWNYGMDVGLITMKGPIMALILYLSRKVRWKSNT